MSGGEVKAQGTFQELSEQNQLPKAQVKPRKKTQTQTKDQPDFAPEGDQNEVCDGTLGSEENSSTSLMGKSMSEVVRESIAKMNDTSESSVDAAQDKGEWAKG